LDIERLNLIISIIRNDPITAIVKANFEHGNNNDEENTNITTKDEKNSIMIFVNTASTCANLAKNLREAGILCVEFHKKLSSKEKRNELNQFRDGLVNIMVCTDSASRGLDLPNVGHVIQAEFALNVVQYLHRVGRCSRAGVLGKATNLVDKNSNDLVDSILSDTISNKNIEDSIELDNANRIDKSFSRRRGFRQKIKKKIKNSIKI
jgi:superfamily II DNA/RNA helicase